MEVIECTVAQGRGSCDPVPIRAVRVVFWSEVISDLSSAAFASLAPRGIRIVETRAAALVEHIRRVERPVGPDPRRAHDLLGRLVNRLADRSPEQEMVIRTRFA